MIAGSGSSRAEDAALDGDGEAVGGLAPSRRGERTRIRRSRPLGPADLEKCLALDRLGLGGWWSHRQWADELAHPQAIGIGGWMGSELVAMAWGRRVVDELQITLVVVAPAWRRTGWGLRMLGDLCRHAAAAGAAEASLEVAAGNAAALALYRRLGFESVGVRPRYYRDGQDALLLSRRGSHRLSTPGPR